MVTDPRKIFILSALLFIFQPTTGIGQPGPQLTPDEITVLKAAEITIRLGQQFSDSIWPGYDLDRIPFIVYIPERWALLLNAPPSAEGFVDYPRGWPKLPTHALYHAGQYGELVGQLAFDLNIDSAAVAAVGFTGQDKRRFLEYVIHENFHQFQYANFGDIPWEREEVYPIEDAVNTSLAYLELRLLTDAVEFQKQAELDSVRDLIAQFAAIRTYRWQQVDPYVGRYEQGQEINEGTAKYVEMKASSLVPKLRYNSSFSDISDTSVSSLNSITMPDCVIEGLNAITAGGVIAPEDMPRNRIYPLGAAQGFLLDQLGVDWKPIAQQAGPTFSFANLLRDALSFDSAQMEPLVVEAKRIYDYETIYEKCKESIAAYRAGFDSAMMAFASQTGVRVEMSLSGKNLLRSRTSSAKKWLADNGSKELRDKYDLYVLRSQSGQEFEFQLKDAALLELTDWKTKDKTLVFLCPEIDSLIVDNLRHNNTDNVEYRFNKLRLNGINFELTSFRAGTISISNNRYSIKLLP